MNPFFSKDYATARERFKQSAQILEMTLESFSIGQYGPNGENLTIDIAIQSGNNSNNALLLSSGLHGVEGFFGSALQLAVMQRWHSEPSSRPAQRLILIHALNPYGFAWRRRANEDNVDLNRNLILSCESFRGSPSIYKDIDGILNPKRPPSPWDWINFRLIYATAKHGQAILEQAITAGQYDYPQGLFYGGTEPSRLNKILSDNLDRWLGNSQKVMHLDFHTGLGAWATYKLLFDHPLNDEQYVRLKSYFGAESVEAITTDQSGWKGGLGHFCKTHAKDRDYICALAEFGTYKGLEVLAGLRAENQSYFWGDPKSKRTEASKKKLVELFCPVSVNWREDSLTQAIKLVGQAVEGLRTESH